MADKGAYHPHEDQEVKIATRNMFYDEQSKHRCTKKEILDGQGNLRAGCSIIPKGEVYESHIFSKKDEWFKSDAFTREVKEMFTEIINSHVKEESEKLSVFQQGGVYLQQRKSERTIRKKQRYGQIMRHGRNGMRCGS